MYGREFSNTSLNDVIIKPRFGLGGRRYASMEHIHDLVIFRDRLYDEKLENGKMYQ